MGCAGEEMVCSSVVPAGGPVSTLSERVSVGSVVMRGGDGEVSSSCNNSPGPAISSASSSFNNILAVSEGFEVAACCGVGASGQVSSSLGRSTGGCVGGGRGVG